MSKTKIILLIIIGLSLGALLGIMIALSLDPKPEAPKTQETPIVKVVMV